MKVRCKACRSIVFVCAAPEGYGTDFICRECKCPMRLDSFSNGLFVLSRPNDPLEDVFDSSGAVFAEDIFVKRIDQFNWCPGIPNGTDPNKPNRVEILKMRLREFETQERYEDCAEIRNELLRISQTI